MKILILSSDSPYHRSGVVARELLNSFRLISSDEIKLLVYKWGFYPDKDICSVNNVLSYYGKAAKRRFKKYFKSFRANPVSVNPDYYMQDLDLTINNFNTKNILKKLDFVPDAIVILFTTRFLTFKNLHELNRETGAPVFLYMMDMAPITGGCHYAWDCKGFTKSCGNCPALIPNHPNDQTNINWNYKKKYIDNSEIIPVAGTEWQYKQIGESSLFKEKEKFKILLSIDPKIFKPSGKSEIRKKLKLPLDKKIIFFGAVSFHEKRKGFKELLESLTHLKKDLSKNEAENIHLIIAGNSKKGFENILPMQHTYLGTLSHSQLAEAYQAADIFVSPSIEDSGPMMINQSVMSGTPVVSFEMGAALDLVITGETGYRVILKDSADLANGIKYILSLDENEYKIMSENCRNLALKLFSPQKQAENFMEVFENYKRSINVN